MIDFRKIWSTVPAEGRTKACHAIFESFSDDALKGVDIVFNDYIAARMRMRPVQVRRLDRKRLSAELDRNLLTDRLAPVAIQYYAVVILTEQLHLDIASSFLTRLGIAHEGGEPAGDSDYPDQPEAEVLRAAVQEMVQAHGTRDSWIYLSSLRFIHHRGGCAPSWPVLYRIADQLERDLAEKREIEKPARKPQPDLDEPAPADQTRLDDLLTNTIIAAVRGDDGTVGPAQLDDLIEEVLSMSVTRHQSFFHRGFADALLDREVGFNRKEYSLERKAWYISGYFNALMRTNREERIWDYLEQPDVRQVLDEGGKTSRAQMHYRVMRMSLRRKNAEWATRVLSWFAENEPLPEPLTQLMEEKLVPLFIESGDGDVAFVSTVLSAMPRSQMNFPLAVLHAQCKHALLQFEHATKLYTELLQQARTENLVRFVSRIETALGLIELGKKDINEIGWPDAAETQPFRDAMKRATPRFEAAIECDRQEIGDSDGRAHFALGLALLLEDSSQALARKHLEHAQARFQEGFPKVEAPIRAFANVLLAVAELEDLEYEGQLSRAAARLRESLPVVVELLPTSLGERLVRASELHVYPELSRAVTEALLRDPEVNRWIPSICSGTQVLRASAALRSQIAEILANKRTLASPRDRFGRLASVLRAALQARGPEGEPAQIYDEMERLVARENTWEDLVVFLRDEANWNEFMHWHDAARSRAHAFEARGMRAEACGVYQEIFYYALKHGDEEGVPKPEFVLSEIEEFKDPLGNLAELKRMIPEKPAAKEELALIFAPGGPDGGIDPHARMRIIYIGGDERQAKLVPSIETEIRDKWPGLELKFFTPGWGSGWGKNFVRYENAIVDAEAVVLSEYVRTTFGINCRKLVSKLNRFLVKSTGGGRNRIMADIREAAAIIVQHRDQPSRKKEAA